MRKAITGRNWVNAQLNFLNIYVQNIFLLLQ